MSYEAAQEHFAGRLETIREQRRMSIVEFCQLLEISRYNYHYYIHQGGMPTLYSAMSIAAKLGMSLDQLLGIRGGKT